MPPLPPSSATVLPAGPAGSAFRHRSFLLFWCARVAGMLAIQMQVVAVGWQVYELTDSTLALGMVGLFQFLPTLALALVAGHVVDSRDRRRVLLAAVLVQAVAVGALCALTAAGALAAAPALVFGVVALVGAAKAFEGPANQAILSALVPPQDLPNAVAWNSSATQTAMVTGPAVGGLLYIAGPAVVYATSTVLLAGAALFIALLRPRRVAQAPRAMSWASLMAGIGFIRGQRAILGAISLDMFAVLLGGATALLPVFARDILHVGPEGMGVLRAAPAIGAVVMAVVLARVGVRRHAGAWMLAGVAGFGAATIVFGLSTDPVLSFAALVAIGATDQVSVVVRMTLIQLATPDEVRGRVGAVNSLFIGASNQLGEFESGAAATLLGAVPAVVLGGVGAIALAAGWARLFPELRRIDRLTDLRRA